MTAKRKPSRPLGVTLLALLQILTGIQLILSALVSFAISSWAATPEGQAEIAELSVRLAENASLIWFLLALVYLALGIAALLLSRGYLNGREWARRKGRVVAAFAILFALIGAIILPVRVGPDSPFWTIVFNVIVIMYLGSSKVRAYFRAHSG